MRTQAAEYHRAGGTHEASEPGIQLRKQMLGKSEQHQDARDADIIRTSSPIQRQGSAKNAEIKTNSAAENPKTQPCVIKNKPPKPEEGMSNADKTKDSDQIKEGMSDEQKQATKVNDAGRDRTEDRAYFKVV